MFCVKVLVLFANRVKLVLIFKVIHGSRNIAEYQSPANRTMSRRVRMVERVWNHHGIYERWKSRRISYKRFHQVHSLELAVEDH